MTRIRDAYDSMSQETYAAALFISFELWTEVYGLVVSISSK